MHFKLEYLEAAMIITYAVESKERNVCIHKCAYFSSFSVGVALLTGTLTAK